MAIRTNPNDKFERLKKCAADARLPFERDAWLNTGFFLNEQYVTWDDNTRTIKRIPRDPKNKRAPRPVFNKIMHYVNTAQAEVLQDKPQGDVLPATDDVVDISDAQVAKAWIDMQASPTMANYDGQLSRTALGAIICGQGYLKWMWSKEEGRMDIMPVSFFEGYPDPYARHWSQWRYFIHSTFMDPEQVYEHWGIEPDKSMIETADPMRTELLRGMGSTPVMTGVTVNELWHKPSRRYPQGLYVVWSGTTQFVAPSPLPYKHRRLPFTVIGAIERPDTQFYMSPVTYLRPGQMALNKYWAQRFAYREKFVNGKWWVPTDLDLEQDPNDAPDQILKGSGPPGVRPELIQPLPWPADNDGADIEQQLMHIVGQREVSQGQVPGRVEAAKAIELLKESDAGRLSTVRDTLSQGNSEGWYQALELARQFEKEECMVMAYSREGVPEVRHFRAGELKPGYRIRTTMTSGLARSRTAKQDTIMNLWLNQVIKDPNVVLQMMDVPLPQGMDYNRTDTTLARNENLILEKGQAVVPNSWDNHEIHLREHNNFRKTQAFFELPDTTKQRFEMHCQMHDTLWDAQIAKQMQRAMLAQPMAPAGPSGPPAGPATPPSDSGTVSE